MYKARDKPLSDIEFTTYYYKKPRRADIVNDDIMCFDIETSSGFLHKDKLDIEPYTGKSQEYYRDCKKFALCYIWQFSINENVFYGRTLEDFADFLYELEFYEPHKKIIYVHNLAFEFAFLINVLKFDYVFARDKRKPIFCTVGSYEFRCSYFLTRMSLDTWAHEKSLPVKKLIGNLDYTLLRTPLTELTDAELEYCFHDVLVMYYGLSQYKEKYGHVIDIPYTQTGEVRQEVRKRMNVPSELKYRQRCIALIPPTLEEYKRQVDVFAGGYTHASYTYSNRVLHDVDSWDISSSYPTVMALETFPMTKFEKVTPCEKYFNSEKWAFMITIRVENLKSVRFNTWLSFSKCKEIKGYKLDNGRVISADYCCVSMTNVDYDIFNQCYKYSSLDIVDFRVSKVGYLSDTFVKYVLELYNNKTQYKGLDEFTATYSQSKQYINSMYGMMVTRTLTDDVRFDADSSEWDKELLNNATYLDKVSHERKKLSKVFSAFQFGAWVTAYARRNLWLGILAIDKYVVYCDTDSIKCVPNSSNFFEEYNRNIERRANERADILNVSREIFAPKDKFGIEHRLGIFDYEGTYYDFKTLGAKKYICGGLYNKFTHKEKQPREELHMTVSGVRKGAVSQLKSIDEFSDGLVFDVEHAKKLLMTYEDDMQSITWNKGAYDEFKSTYKHGIVAQPTTYSMAMTPEYMQLILENKRGQTEVLKMRQKYYSIKNLLSKNAQYNILLGERSNGKSYATKYMMLWEAFNELDYFGFLEKNKISKKRYQFAYIRRWQDEVKARDVELYFADMPISEITTGQYNGVECYRRDIYFKFTDENGVSTRGKKIGSAFALTGVTHYKSLAFPLIGNIVFEEFITNQGYIGHEVDNLTDLVSTIARRDSVRVFMVGNTINRLCPYFTEWELSHVKEQAQGTIDIYTHTTNQIDEEGKPIEIVIAVEYCANSGKNSQMFFGKKSEMITSGTWSTSEFPHLPRPINTYHIKYSIYYKYNQFAFRIDLICDNKERFLYVSDAPSEVPQRIKRVVTDEFTTSKYATYYLTEKTRYDTIIIELLAQRKVFFSSNLTGTEFWQVKKERGRF